MLRVNFPILILVIGISEDEKNIWNTKEVIRGELEHIKESQVSREILAKSYIEHMINTNVSCFVVDDRFKEMSSCVKKSRNKLNKYVNSITEKYASLKTFECGTKNYNKNLKKLKSTEKVKKKKKKTLKVFWGLNYI